MNNDGLLRITSLCAVALASLHISDDVVRGIEPTAGFAFLRGMLTLSVWLLAALLGVGRRWGYVLLILGGLLAMLMPVTHSLGRGVARFVETPGALLFVWTLYGLALTGVASVVLGARGLWLSRRPDAAAPP
ncbi:MAG TPA: hypothetical protein VFL14_02995 [Xanthomonadales bacterium]|nr:hypothetical protein [Xanthomonadales bacterium]